MLIPIRQFQFALFIMALCYAFVMRTLLLCLKVSSGMLINMSSSIYLFNKWGCI